VNYYIRKAPQIKAAAAQEPHGALWGVLLVESRVICPYMVITQSLPGVLFLCCGDLRLYIVIMGIQLDSTPVAGSPQCS